MQVYPYIPAGAPVGADQTFATILTKLQSAARGMCSMNSCYKLL